MVDKFLEFEKREGLFDKQVGSVNLWGFIRAYIYMQILEKSGVSNYEKQKNVGKLKDTLKVLKNCIFHNPMIITKRKKILFIQTYRKEKWDDGLEECIFTGEISREFSEDSYLVVLPHRGKGGVATKGRDTIYLDYVVYFSTMYRRFLELKNKKLNNEINIYANELKNSLNMEFGIDFKEEDFARELRYNYYVLTSMKKLFIKLFKKISPLLIVEVCGYGSVQMAINDVAKELGIKTIELQHGVITKNHLGYNYPEKKEYPFFPDEIFLFSEYWKKNARLPIEQSKLIVTGFPYMDRNKKKYKDMKDTHRELNILVISQPTDVERFSSVILCFIEKMNQLKIKYHLVYKLHPSEYYMKNETYDLIESFHEVTMVKDDQLNLYHYYALADVQVGMYSTAIYEGLAFGLSTYLLNTKLTMMHMKDLYIEGYVKLFDDGEELADLLLDSKPEEKREEYLKVFFCEGATERIVSEIKKRVM